MYSRGHAASDHSDRAFANWEDSGGSGPWPYLVGFSKCFPCWPFKPTKTTAGDVHLRRHHDRKIGNFLLHLLVPSDLNGSSRKTCKINKNRNKKEEISISLSADYGSIRAFANWEG